MAPHDVSLGARHGGELQMRHMWSRSTLVLIVVHCFWISESYSRSWRFWHCFAFSVLRRVEVYVTDDYRAKSRLKDQRETPANENGFLRFLYLQNKQSWEPV